jgi:hypothetical protein
MFRLVHHSRNTAGKQWNETLSLALGGVVRVYKLFFSSLKSIPSFEVAWTKLFDQLVHFIAQDGYEVSTVIINMNRS